MYLLLVPIVSTSCGQVEQQFIPKKFQLNTIIIDAGHGGHDKGAVGLNHQEKDIALAIAQQVGAEIRQQMPNIQVVYTRNDDRFLTLRERVQRIHQSNAELLISIHCNAGSKTNRGIELYTFGFSPMKEQQLVAMRENGVVFLESGSPLSYGADPSQPAYYQYRPSQQSFHAWSKQLANRMHSAMNAQAISSRGVHEGAFLLLRDVQIPGIIIQTGYITNRSEEAYLSSRQGKQALAQSIRAGIQAYKGDLDEQAAKIIAQNADKIAQLKYEREQKQAQDAAKRRQEELERQRALEKNWAWPSLRSLGLQGEQYFVQLEMNQSYEKQDFPYKNIVMQRIDVVDSYKYMVGPYKTKAEAKQIHQEAQSKGFRKATIVKYKDGKLIR